jgi:hypothetical protein
MYRPTDKNRLCKLYDSLWLVRNITISLKVHHYKLVMEIVTIARTRVGCTFSEQKLEQAFDFHVRHFRFNIWLWGAAILTEMLFGFP